MQTPFQNSTGFSHTCDVAELQKRISQAHNATYGLDRQLSMLCRRMSDDSPCWSKSATFEDALQSHWESQEAALASSDEEEEEASYKLKYLCLKARYNKMASSHLDELDTLHEEIASLQERIQQLDAAKCRAQNNEVSLAETLQATTSQVSNELADLCCENHALFCENQGLMQELVSAKLELAQLSEREVVWKRELYKTKETNKSFACKMSKLETLMSDLSGKR